MSIIRLAKFGKKQAQTVKSSITSRAIASNLLHVQNDNLDDEGVERTDLSDIESDSLVSEMPISKRNRRSEENELAV